MSGKFFISYSNVDGNETAYRLADDLRSEGTPIWLESRKMQGAFDWDEQIVEALRACAGVLFLMTPDSVHPKSECKREWTRALRYKKPIIPLLLDNAAEMPYRLEPRQYIDFTDGYEQGLARLRRDIRKRASPEGQLLHLQDRLSDAERDLPRAPASERARIEDEIAQLQTQIAAQERLIRDPDAAAEKTQARIETGLDREREPALPVRPDTRTKFINPPPAVAPSWFQDRHVETGLIGEFLKDDALRLMTVVGRGGVGKTAMVCRLLKALEAGHLPDDGGPLAVDGIVYLSPMGSRQLTFPHLFADLCKLLPAKAAEWLESIYRNPQAPTTAKMQALLEHFPGGRTLVLLDNFEQALDGGTGQVRDQELDEALRALLELPQHGVRLIITTREAPRRLLLTQPGRQTLLELDHGLQSPFAENILRAMDADGKLGLRDAPTERLDAARARTQGYPRALEALAAILAADRDTTLEELLQDTERLLPDHVVEVLVGEAFSRLDARAQQVMQALAAYAHPVGPAAVDYLLQPHVPDIDSAPLLRRLVGMQFARSEAGRYYLHQLDRDYALHRLTHGDPADRDASPAPYTRLALLHRAANYFEQIRTPRESWKDIVDLEPQLAELELRIAGGELDTAASLLLDISFDYLMLWGHTRLTADLHERLVDGIGDRSLLSSSLTNLGSCNYSLGDYPRAIELYEQALAIAREIGNRQGESAALGNLGLCYYRLGDYRHAIEHQEQSLAIDREIGDRQGEGTRLGNLGLCYADLGDYPHAIEHQEQSLAIAREIGDRQGEGNALGNLGGCYADFGDYPRAIELYEQALTIARGIGDKYLESSVLVLLGSCYRDTGDFAEATRHFEEAIAIAGATGNAQNLSEARLGLARTQLYSGELSAARQTIDDALKIDYPPDRAAVRVTTGSLAIRQGRAAEAQAAFSEALAVAEASLKRTAQNLAALDTKALALCGLALCGDPNRAVAAAAAYRAARETSSAKGVIAAALKRFDALAAADTGGILAGVRDSAGG